MTDETFEANFDMVNLGIFLFENGKFKGRMSLTVRFMIVFMLTCFTQYYFTILSLKQVDFLTFVKVLLKLEAD